MTDGELTTNDTAGGQHNAGPADGVARVSRWSLNGQLNELVAALVSEGYKAAESDAPPLPEGVFHLLIADADLAERTHQMRLTLCGASVRPSRLPRSCPADGIADVREPRYCLECVSEAVRWSAESAEVPSE